LTKRGTTRKPNHPFLSEKKMTCLEFELKIKGGGSTRISNRIPKQQL